MPFLPVVDEWALGVCLHLLLSGDFPFDAEDRDDLEELIIAADLSVIRRCEEDEIDLEDEDEDDEDDEDEGNEDDGENEGGETGGSAGKAAARAVARGRRAVKREAWRRVSREGRDLLLGLLHPRPRKRLTARAALEHPWFGAFNETLIANKASAASEVVGNSGAGGAGAGEAAAGGIAEGISGGPAAAAAAAAAAATAAVRQTKAGRRSC